MYIVQKRQDKFISSVWGTNAFVPGSLLTLRILLWYLKEQQELKHADACIVALKKYLKRVLT